MYIPFLKIKMQLLEEEGFSIIIVGGRGWDFFCLLGFCSLACSNFGELEKLLQYTVKIVLPFFSSSHCYLALALEVS